MCTANRGRGLRKQKLPYPSVYFAVKGSAELGVLVRSVKAVLHAVAQVAAVVDTAIARGAPDLQRTEWVFWGG